MDKKQLNMDNAVFDFVFQMALSDATRRVADDSDRYLGDNDVKEIVHEYASAIIDSDDEPIFDAAVKGIQNRFPDLYFGKIQKLINMTMKYLYIRYYDNPKIRNRFNACHAPMDSIMRDFVYKSYYYFTTPNGRKPKYAEPIFNPECSWSKIGNPDYPQYKKEDYDNYQLAIQTIIDEAKKKGFLISNKIEFDYLFWDKAKLLRDGADNKDNIVDIWEEALNTK